MEVYSGIGKHSDDRGDLLELLPDVTQAIHAVLYCTGKTGAVRGSHVHAKDTHFCYVLSGTIQYEWFEGEERKSRVLSPGDCVFTPVGEKHRFVFLTDGAFIAMATEPRTQNSYESDTTRVNF